MRHLLFWAIGAYYRAVPAERRHTCLFRETCSQHVERIAIEAGAVAAVRALWRRFRCCRPGYHFEINADSGAWQLVCADGSRFPASVAAAGLAPELRWAQRLAQPAGPVQCRRREWWQP